MAIRRNELSVRYRSAAACRFRVLGARGRRALTLVIHDGARARATHPMPRDDDGVFDADRSTAPRAGDRYSYRDRRRRDRGPIRRRDSSRTACTARRRSSIPAPSRGPTTAGAAAAPAIASSTSCTSARSRRKERSPAPRRGSTTLRDLGVTAIEIMPVADFPGARNWGYDGVCLFAPSRAYGHPDDLRRARRSRARARPGGRPRRRLQPPRARGRLPAGVQPATTSPIGTRRRGDAASTSMARARRWCGASSSTTRCTGCASTTSTACGSTRRMR